MLPRYRVLTISSLPGRQPKSYWIGYPPNQPPFFAKCSYNELHNHFLGAEPFHVVMLRINCLTKKMNMISVGIMGKNNLRYYIMRKTMQDKNGRTRKIYQLKAKLKNAHYWDPSTVICSFRNIPRRYIKEIKHAPLLIKLEKLLR